MGNVSSATVAEGLQALRHVSGAHAVPLQDSTWAALVAPASPLASSDPAAVDQAIRPHIAALVYNNAQTLNCQRLLYLVAQQLRQAAACGGSGTVAVANAVHVARAVLKDLIEQLNPDQLRSFIELPPAGAAPGPRPPLQVELTALHQGSLVSTLCWAALTRLSCSPDPTAEEYLLQYELVNLLLVLCSSQLYTSHAHPIPGAHPFLESIMTQQDLATPAVQALLLTFVQSPLPPPSLHLYRPADTRTMLHIVRSAAVSMFWLPYTAYTLLLRRGGSQQDAAASPLADAAVLLLLALQFHPVDPDGRAGNPFRQALRRLQDADYIGIDAAAAEDGRGALAAGRAAVSYAGLYDALGRSLVGREASVLLLYALLHGTPTFHEYCLARSDLDTLLLPLLELLYGARERSANQLYMLLIIILILSQEPSFAQNVHRITLSSVPFYKERSLANTTLGSLLVVLLLRTALGNLAWQRDLYMHTNTLAALANLAPHMAGLSSHAAQRLVSLFQVLARREARLAQEEGEDWSPAQPGATPGRDTPHREMELQLNSESLHIVLEIINSTLASALPANPELVFALLHRQEVFDPFRAHPQYAGLMDNVAAVTEHFGRRVDEAIGGAPAGDVSAERVLDLIKRHSRGWRRDLLKAVPELRFSYEEEASPEVYFVPYVWSLAVALPTIPWTLSAITLFTPTIMREGSAGVESAAPLSPQQPRLGTPLPGSEGAPLPVATNV